MFINLVGEKFGKLTVLALYQKGKHSKWICKCECFNFHIAVGGNLKSGVTRSCGCLMREVKRDLSKIIKHGKYKSQEFNTWHMMLQRCYKKNATGYENYGGRGIKVCDRWRDSFQNFYEDMGNKPSQDHTLDRIDVNGDYELSNCKWSTKFQQSVNQRTRKDNTSGVRGVSKSKKSWLSYINVNGSRIRLGLYSNKEEAIKARKEAELKYWGRTS